MMRLPTRRRAFSTLTALTVAAALAGCGDDAPSTGAGGGSGDESAEGRTLLKDSFTKITKDGTAITSGAFSMKISGKVEVPKDEDVRGIEGSAQISAAVDPNTEKALLPPFKMSFDVDGNFVDGAGKKSEGKFKGGAAYVGNAFFANWDGKDYAVGQQLSQQLLAELEKADKQTGGNGNGALGGVDPQKLIDGMQLDAGTWVKDPKVEEGGQLDGVDTFKVTGAVDAAVVVDDVTEGLRNLPTAVPELPGVKELAKVSDASEKDVKELEDAITKLDLAVWVGKDDKIQRRMTLDIGLESKDAEEPFTADLKIDFAGSKINQKQGITAPAQPAPITDLFVILQEKFGSLFQRAQPARTTVS